MICRRNLYFLLLALAATVPAYGQDAGSVDVASLSEGKVDVKDVSKSGVPGKSFVTGTVIGAPMTKLCAILQDYSSYPDFMPNVAQAKVAQSGDDFTIVDMTLKLPLGRIKKYRLRMDPQSNAQQCRLSWKLIPSKELAPEETITDTSGHWLLTPLAADGNKTVVRHFVYTDPGPVPFGFGWIVDALSKDSIPKMMESLKKKAAG